MPLGIQNYKGTFTALHDIGFAVKPGLSGTGSSDDHDVQVPSVLPAVQTDPHIPGKQFVVFRDPVGISFVQRFRVSPFRRAVFFATAVIPPGGEPDADADSIDHQEKQNCSQCVFCYPDLKRLPEST